MFEMQTIKTSFSQGCFKSLILNENGNPQDRATYYTQYSDYQFNFTNL